MTATASTPDSWQAKHVAALRKARNETQAELAKAVGVDEHSVWMWERGRRPPSRPVNVRRLIGLLESLNPGERERYDRELARLEEAGGASGYQAARLATAAPAPPAAKEQPVHRRDANRHLATMAAAGIVLPLSDLAEKARWVPAHRIDAGLVATREDIMSTFVTAYDEGGTRACDLLPTVAAFADGLGPLLRRVPTWELGLRLAALLVDAHSLAGVFASTSDPQATRRHLATATRIAVASGDPILKARAWAAEAKMVHSPLEDGRGSTRQTVEQLRRAKALARHADGHTRAWLLRSFVEEAADLGDLRLCHATLDAAYRAFDSATGHDSGFFSPRGCFGGALGLARVSGRVAGMAGRLDEAERLIATAVSGWTDRPGSKIGTLCALATVRIENDEPEGACVALSDALATGRPGLMLPRIRAVRLRLDPALDTLAYVRALDEQLHAAA